MAMMSSGTPLLQLTLLAVIAALTTALAGLSCLETRSTSGPTEPGISDDLVMFGQSAVFRGPQQELGRQMRLGIQAAFYEVNQAGGVHGRQLKLETIDDSYEPDLSDAHHPVAHRASAGLRSHRRGGHAHVPRRGPACPRRRRSFPGSAHRCGVPA